SATALGGAVIVTGQAVAGDAVAPLTAGATVTAGNVMTVPASNTLGFGSGGELLTEVGAPISFPWVSAAASSIGLDFGDAVTTDQQVAGAGGLGLNGTVQLAGSFATRGMTRDGFTSGFLDRLETDSTGRIFGVFTNGQRRPIFQVALANFPNDSVLTSVGNNLKQETIASGTAVLEKPGNGGMGTITPFGLEQSNVDLAGEFVKLIVVQRGYEANSKTILTTDQMLSALMQIKR
ncbi:MAG: flagellar hook-basal body complex protein, partial [Mariprofundaceae bacterium]